MADIKVRRVDRGSIRTLEHTISSSHRVKEAYVRTKSLINDAALDSEDEKNIHTRAYDEMTAGAADAGTAAISAGEFAAKIAAHRRGEQSDHVPGSDIAGSEYGHDYSYDYIGSREHSGTAGRTGSKIPEDHDHAKPGRSIEEKGREEAKRDYAKKKLEERTSGKSTRERIGRARGASSDEGISSRLDRLRGIGKISDRSTSNGSIRAGIRGRVGKDGEAGGVLPNDLMQRHQRNLWIRSAQKNSGGIIERLRAILSGRNSGTAANRMKEILAGRRLMNMTFLSAGSLAVVVVTLFTMFGAAFYTPGGEEYSDDPAFWNVYGNGSEALVQVATQEIGNQGGRKFWSWYGFSGRVSWCACFVSWCENECGYLKSGAAPRFSWVGSGADWFKHSGQWAGRSYTPKGGDIIFFDWDSDGELDHVGIVESCDGRIVHTIEGNSGDACRRRSYVKGRAPITGYGLIFTERQSGKNSAF